jgi:hypothetical protein
MSVACGAPKSALRRGATSGDDVPRWPKPPHRIFMRTNNPVSSGIHRGATAAMIDNPVQVERLIALLREALPLEARLSPAVVATLRAEMPDIDAVKRYRVWRVDYAGDEGGIMCGVRLTDAEAGRALHVSITHLIFDRGQPWAREIAAYQKHRDKRLRRMHAGR